MAAHRSILTWIKDVVLFFAAPAIALAYLALFPFIGLMLLNQYLKAKREQKAQA